MTILNIGNKKTIGGIRLKTKRNVKRFETDLKMKNFKRPIKKS